MVDMSEKATSPVIKQDRGLRVRPYMGDRSSSRSTRPRTCKPLPSPLMCLPNELLLAIVKRVRHVKDLLNVRCTHPVFRDIIDENPHSLWRHISFKTLWPVATNMDYFVKAADHKNFEALVKLGVAHLYNEGSKYGEAGEDDDAIIMLNSQNAANYFMEAEQTKSLHEMPFSWLFFRPPWNLSGKSCKEHVFKKFSAAVCDNIEEYGKAGHVVPVCVMQCLQKLIREHDRERSQSEIETLARLRNQCLQQGVALGSPHAAFFQYQYADYNTRHPHQKARQEAANLHAADELGSLDARIELCRRHASDTTAKRGVKRKSASLVRHFIQRSTACNFRPGMYKRNTTHNMRFILVDWIVEVAYSKEFSDETLHMAVDILDRFLSCNAVPRSSLQLVGVAAILLATKYYEEVFMLTIREAAHLTDSSYNSSQVVRMMGEITVALRGEFRTATCWDYTQIIARVGDSNEKLVHMACYMTELALLHSDLLQTKRSKLSAAAVLLARLTLRQGHPWPKEMEDYTGYTAKDLFFLVAMIHTKSFVNDPVLDSRGIEINAVYMRYGMESKMCVSTEPMLAVREVGSIMNFLTTDSFPPSCLPYIRDLSRPWDTPELMERALLAEAELSYYVSSLPDLSDFLQALSSVNSSTIVTSWLQYTERWYNMIIKVLEREKNLFEGVDMKDLALKVFRETCVEEMAMRGLEGVSLEQPKVDKAMFSLSPMQSGNFIVMGGVEVVCETGTTGRSSSRKLPSSQANSPPAHPKHPSISPQPCPIHPSSESQTNSPQAHPKHPSNSPQPYPKHSSPSPSPPSNSPKAFPKAKHSSSESQNQNTPHPNSKHPSNSPQGHPKHPSSTSQSNSPQPYPNCPPPYPKPSTDDSNVRSEASHETPPARIEVRKRASPHDIPGPSTKYKKLP